jgi:hypothetical protein
MKKILIILTATIVLSFCANAQQGKDVLFLKNGSVIYGSLTEIKDGRYTISTTGGLIFTYTTDEVDKFIVGAQSKSGKVQINDINGIGLGIESGFLIGSSNQNFPLLFSFNPMFTFTFADRNTIGFVSGIEAYDQLYLPLLFEYRYNILNADVSPFIYARGGGLISLEGDDDYEEYLGGWTLGIGTGFRWPIAGFESFIKFGFRYGFTVHKVDSYYDYIDEETFPADFTYHANFYRLEMKWGFKF